MRNKIPGIWAKEVPDLHIECMPSDSVRQNQDSRGANSSDDMEAEIRIPKSLMKRTSNAATRNKMSVGLVAHTYALAHARP